MPAIWRRFVTAFGFALVGDRISGWDFERRASLAAKIADLEERKDRE